MLPVPVGPIDFRDFSTLRRAVTFGELCGVCVALADLVSYFVFMERNGSRRALAVVWSAMHDRAIQSGRGVLLVARELTRRHSVCSLN